MGKTHRNYNPAGLIVTLGAIQVGGWADGEMIKAMRNEDGFELKVGAVGDTVRSQNHNRSGLVTLTLMAASFSNDQLSALHALDELTGTGARALLIKEPNGTTLVKAASAWVRRYAEVNFSKEAPDREWEIECAELLPFVGGLVV